jgi:hypothetical protein
VIGAEGRLIPTDDYTAATGAADELLIDTRLGDLSDARHSFAAKPRARVAGRHNVTPLKHPAVADCARNVCSAVSPVRSYDRGARDFKMIEFGACGRLPWRD